MPCYNEEQGMCDAIATVKVKICMAIMGEYMAKMYMETKKRPRYYISETLR